MYNWCTRLKAHDSTRPKLCRGCNKFYDRLDTHLRSKPHKIKDAGQIKIETQACQRKMKDFLNFRDLFPRMKHNTLPSTLSSFETSTSRRSSISTAKEHTSSPKKRKTGYVIIFCTLKHQGLFRTFTKVSLFSSHSLLSPIHL
uniref:Uncharacterized protein n=1 Tax=Clytia hemisphaerica TaxID=252671 RepID=A0A7M5XH40_9CNID